MNDAAALLRGPPRRARHGRREAALDDAGPQVWGRPAEEQQRAGAAGPGAAGPGAASPSAAPAKPRTKPNFALSGALNKDSATGNSLNGVVLKWSEPADAATPPGPGWRLYVFKGAEELDTLHLHRRSAYLFGREAKVADILTEHDSCSKQHAVLQFRFKTAAPAPGSLDAPARSVRPYLLDLESTNGTFVNGQRLEPARFVELREKDVIKVGESSREYVLVRAPAEHGHAPVEPVDGEGAGQNGPAIAARAVPRPADSEAPARRVEV
jgi:smad nuclear-interacting protein 1